MIKDYQLSTDIDKNYLNHRSENIKEIELSYMRKYDAVFALSEADRERLLNDLPKTPVYLSPYPVLESDISDEILLKNSIKNIVFMGNEGHQSNRDAVYWFVKEILPSINPENYTNIYITGVWSSETMKEIATPGSKIKFTGFINDLKSVLNNSVSIVPVRIGGGGVRTKIIYAMASNSAVVTTSTGAAGISGKDGRDFLLADTGEDFAVSLNEVLRNQALFENLVRNGRNFIQKHYSQKVLTMRRNEFYYQIIDK